MLRKRQHGRPPTALREAEADRLGRLPVDPAFLTGNGFAARCRHVLNYSGLTVNESGQEDWYFCKTDHLDWFFERCAPRRPYVLVSHNSDHPVDRRFRARLRSRNLKAWFAVNVEFRHKRLHPIPLGIANPGWAHGDTTPLREAQGIRDKSELFDVSFSVETNPAVRRDCLERTGLPLAPPLPHREHLARLARAYFSLAPSGHGIDTHRMWEALYVRTVPVVTRSALTDAHPDLPLVVLEDWADFAAVDFGPELYRGLLGDWDPASLSMDAYFERLRLRVVSV